MRLLYVEDDPRQARAMTRWLASRGFEVTHVASLDAALSRFAFTNAFDVIVTDWDLEGLTSASLVELAKAHRVPCCIYSGSCPLIGSITKPDLDALRSWLAGVAGGEGRA